MIKKIITNFEDPHKTIETEYGEISYKAWCGLEAKRIGKCKVVEDFKGCVAIERSYK